ncbi:MAG: acetoin utilization protein AcuC [Chloroflexota bacterium]|nr:acetoin utilization protein AcuC [Chloroflexota bacterium]
MSGPLHVYYGPEILLYDFGPGHPFNQRRVELSVELMEACGLFQANGNSLRPIQQGTREDALLFHEARYLEFLAQASVRGDGVLDHGDTPAFPGCLDASLWGVGASLDALGAVMTGEGHAFSPGGGWHHGYRDHASGFCILNDGAIALAAARERYDVTRALYLDIDVHHGDGVFYGFYQDGWLLDIDFHQDGRTLFPGKGFVGEVGTGEAAGTKLNIPLLQGAGDDAALLAWREVAVPAIRAFRPELIVMQCGADAHAGDPLAMLEWSLGAYTEIITSVHALAHAVADGRLLLLGGGGYNPANVCLVWPAIAHMVGDVPLPDRVPENWRESFEDTYGRRAPERFSEPPTSATRPLQAAARCVEELRRLSPLASRA